MSGTSAATPLLVYNRIDVNRRTTRLVLAAFVVAVLPVASLATFFIFPQIHLMFFAVSPSLARLSQPALLTLSAGFFLISTVLVVLILAAIVDRIVSNHSGGFILRLAHAQQVASVEAPELVALVENLCIAAGLPTPNIHVIESASPNAFAVGGSPNDASLVVTRGMLELLDRRELSSVIAHELSHIGNHDIALSAALAAFIRTLALPLTVLSAPFRIAVDAPGPVGVIVCAAAVVVLFGSGTLPMLLQLLVVFVYAMQVYLPGNGFGWWWEIYAMVLPVYAVFGAPFAALLVRQAVSHQRAFLADADAALVTRDPEGLAMALVKAAAATRDSLSIGESGAHLCFVDPTPNSWLHFAFPSHPRLADRVDVLARMGTGIPPSTIAAARAAAAKFWRESDAKQTQSSDQASSQPQTPEPSGFEGLTRLYDGPDDASRVLALLGDDDAIEVRGREGDFVRIITEDGTLGYVFRPLPAGSSAEK